MLFFLDSSEPNGEKIVSKSMQLLLDCGYSRSEMAANPVLLSYSYEHRIEPRGRYVKMCRNIKQIEALPSLTALVEVTDEEFALQCGVETEHYQRWVKETRSDDFFCV